MRMSYYIDLIERRLLRITNKTKRSEIQKEYDEAFDIESDALLIRKLRVIAEKTNKVIDSQEMDWS